MSQLLYLSRQDVESLGIRYVQSAIQRPLAPHWASAIGGFLIVGHNVDRVGVVTGVYLLGAPRQIE
jgi:hypothetical protein